MTTEAQVVSGTPAATPEPVAATPPVQATPPAASQPVVTPAAAAPQGSAAAEVVSRVPTRKLLSDSDEDIPTDADTIEMSPRAFRARLERFTKKQLREQFGTDDPTAIKAQQEELARYRQEREQHRIAQMSETERLKEELTRERGMREAAEQQFQHAEDSRVIDDVQRKVNDFANRYMDADYHEVELPRLKKFIMGCSEADLENPDEVIEEWFKRRIEAKPKLGRDYGTSGDQGASLGTAQGASQGTAQGASQGQPPAAAPQRVQVPFTNGPPPNRPSPPAAGAAMQKTAAPGRPNSMSEAELREEKRKLGLNW